MIISQYFSCFHPYKTSSSTAVEIPFHKNSCNFRECFHSPDHNLRLRSTPEKYLTDLKLSNIQKKKIVGNRKHFAAMLSNFPAFQPQCVCRYCCYSNLKIQTLTFGTRVGTFIYIFKAKKKKTLLNATFIEIRANGEDGRTGIID